MHLRNPDNPHEHWALSCAEGPGGPTPCSPPLCVFRKSPLVFAMQGSYKKRIESLAFSLEESNSWCHKAVQPDRQVSLSSLHRTDSASHPICTAQAFVLALLREGPGRQEKGPLKNSDQFILCFIQLEKWLKLTSQRILGDYLVCFYTYLPPKCPDQCYILEWSAGTSKRQWWETARSWAG